MPDKTKWVNEWKQKAENDLRILHFDRCEPEYPEKKGKILLGNISPNSDRTIAFYLDPLMCRKITFFTPFL